jgi:large subunit ribosomal protein L15
MGTRRGKTAGRGAKGQHSRAGSSLRPGFEGGQMPLHRRLPKRGFTNIFKKKFQVINLSDLAEWNAAEPVTPEKLHERGLIGRMGDGVKVLGDGELKAALHISAHRFSKSALTKIEGAGGKAEVLAL